MGTVVYERVETSGDDRVCADCRPLHSAVFAQGSGPQPPLHPHCRCRRVFAWEVEVPQSPIAPSPAPAPMPLPWTIVVVGETPDERPKEEQP